MAKAKGARRTRNDPDGFNPRGFHDPKKQAAQDRADDAIRAEAKRLGFKDDSFGPTVTKEMRDFVAKHGKKTNSGVSGRTTTNGTNMTNAQKAAKARGHFMSYKRATQNNDRKTAAEQKAKIEALGYHIANGVMKPGGPGTNTSAGPKPKQAAKKSASAKLVGGHANKGFFAPGAQALLKEYDARLNDARKAEIRKELEKYDVYYNSSFGGFQEGKNNSTAARFGRAVGSKSSASSSGGGGGGLVPSKAAKSKGPSAREKAKAANEKLRRLIALSDSSNPNEADNAKRKAEEMVANGAGTPAQRAKVMGKARTRTRAAQKKTPVAAKARKAKETMAAKKTAKKAAKKAGGGNKPGMRRFKRADGTYGYVPDNRGGKAVKAAGRKPAAKKTTTRKAAAKSSTSSSGVRMRTVRRNGRTYKVPDNRNGAAVKAAGRKGGSKAAGSKKAAKKATKVYGKKAPKGSRVSGRGTSVSYTKGRTTTTISRTYRSNPMGNIGMMVTLSIGACLGWLISDLADRYVATMAPKGVDQKNVSGIDNAMSIAARPDGTRLLVQALIAAIPAALAYYLARKNKTSPALFIGGIAVGAIVKLVADSLANQNLMPKVFPASKPGEAATLGDRLYYEYGDQIQAELSKSIEARNAALTKALPPSTVAGRSSLAGVGEALPTRGSQPRAGLNVPATAAQSFAPVAPVRALASEVGGQLGCGGNGCGSCGACRTHHAPALPPGGVSFMPGLNTPATRPGGATVPGGSPVLVDQPEGPADAPGGTRTPTGAPLYTGGLRPAFPLSLPLPAPVRTNDIATELSSRPLLRPSASKAKPTVGGLIRSN